jgi:hypothetical protein
MSQATYENFDLEFYQSGGADYVKARSFAGEAKHEFLPPFDLAEASQFPGGLGFSPADEADNSDRLKKAGAKLFDAVFQNDIRAIYKTGLGLANTQGKSGLRIRLHLQEVPALSRLPWEYLHDAATNQFLSLDLQTPVVRYFEIAKIILPLPIELPLHILALVSSPMNLPALQVDAEKEKMSAALNDLEGQGLVAINWLETATVAELQKALRRSQYHVFHFIGHGDFDEAAKQGWLAFENEDELADRLYADQFGAILNNHPSFRLVVLNSCKGACAATTNPFAGTAATLVQQGMPAVVAMQSAIADATAIKLASEFYAAIADGAPVDVAITEARVAIFAGVSHLEWGAPVLFMRSSDGTLFDMKTGRATETDKPPAPPRTISKRRALFYALVTLLFGAIFLAISVIPKNTVIEIEAFARRLSFALPPEIANGQEVPLLYSAVWANSISIKNFQPLELWFDSVDIQETGTDVENPLTISPESGDGRVTFLSTASDISLQEAVCDSGSKICFEREGEIIYLEVKRSSQAPYLTVSFGKYIDLSVQACQVVDGAEHDLTLMFGRPVQMKLQDYSRALTVSGANGELQTSIKKAPAALAERAVFIPRQLIQALAFSKEVYHHGQIISASTLDSVSVKRNFPFVSAAFSSREAGDLEIMAAPNRFVIYDLSESGSGLQVRAQGKLRSLRIGRGALRRELVPKYLTVITENPVTALAVTVTGWIMTVIVPLILQFRYRNKGEDRDA